MSRYGHRQSIVSALRTLVPLTVVLVIACGAPAPLGEQQLFAEANAEFEARNFSTATTLYKQLLDQYPFSELSEEARLRIAHAYHLAGKYENAIEAFEEFQRLHPTSPLLPFVEYSIGMAYLDQARSRDRDKSASEAALRQFERVREHYPGTIYGRLAEYRTRQCIENLAWHELYVGDFYARAGRHSAAERRYRSLVERYPDSDAAALAARRLAALAENPRPPRERVLTEADAP